ncbi:MAG TPA: tetratricopeptide repeat protein, partial [Gemmatimonadaceae bacterium]|nr:tetratricopeptide repeat protein [Gemmatimonadaceae bacterium]
MSTIRPPLAREDRTGRSVFEPPGRPWPGALIDAIQALTEDAREAERRGDRNAARQGYERALRTLSPGVPGACARASALLRWIARTYDADGDAEAALDCLEASLAIAEAAGDEGSRGHALNVKSTVRWRQGDSDDAQRCLLRAHGHALA